MRFASIALAIAGFVSLSGGQAAGANDPWTTDQYQLGGANNHQASQFGATIGSAPATQTQSALDRTQNAVTGTTNTLREGVESGIKQANQQVQNVTGFGNQAQPQSTNSWPAPPPGLSTAAPAGATKPASSSGWTSIRSEMAPPTLLAPPLTPLSSSSTSGSISSSASGPSFPSSSLPTSSATAQRDQFHSVLTDPSSTSRQSPATTSQTAAKSPDWNSGWGSNTSNQAGTGSSSLPRVGPEVPRPNTGGFATDTDPWNRPLTSSSSPSSSTAAPRLSSNTPVAEDRYNPSPSSTQNGSNIWAGLPAQSTASSVSPPLGNFSNQPSTGFSNFPNQPATGQPNLAQPGLNPPTFGQNPNQPLLSQPGFGNQNGMAGQQQTNPEQLPWTLLVVSLLFAGSFGGNIYLGWSYADSRYRYYLLARRTTESFHKAVGIAA